MIYLVVELRYSILYTILTILAVRILTFSIDKDEYNQSKKNLMMTPSQREEFDKFLKENKII